MNKQNDKYWRTDNLYVAAFLFSRGAIVVGIDVAGRRAVFSFINSPERESWGEEFESGTPMIDVRIYIAALETLRQKRLDARMQFDADR